MLLSAVTVGGCGDGDTAGDEQGADVEEIQETSFWSDVDKWVGKKVTVSADVNEVLNQHSFTLTGHPESDVDEVLVVSATTADVTEGQTVKVTGTVKAGFNAEAVKKDLGVNWNDPLYKDWIDEHYLVASSVDTTVNG
ncbi:hypothetical protein ACIQ8D_33885 [Streptomyces sp. NPDC096094]|uniref:hypothetical protein n=1 Tax=Streptomyces sp. NPDC096094 TaxID=3366073 RepID=UPI0037FA50E0